ncbi:class D sortase [Ectobacillus funiculus]|uniref:class D sortase n=1 Tax=Ectobacillus funiculus TaxID=137993 RepID=UPI00397BBE77
MWQRLVSAGVILIGLTMLLYNSYWLTKGLTMYEEPKRMVNQNDIKQEDHRIQKLHEDTPEIGEKIGILTIPKLERSIPIYQGTDEEILKKGVGHYTRSVLPGNNNNAVLSGHRDTVFRGLDKVGKHDTLIVTTKAGEFLYKVKKVRIVDKNDRTVIVPKPKSTLTVTTCYPFSFIGDAPKRYVLVAELLTKK